MEQLPIPGQQDRWSLGRGLEDESFDEISQQRSKRTNTPPPLKTHEHVASRVFDAIRLRLSPTLVAT
ncbi:hypothetical protein EYF80_039160 [Liparis tanakae]|uniref:Uncharacterized protein n=1 Tax=Liparis tanakae TaxID=230148 RepID=A0A4Z2GAN1_9TELE|nr:hypothetical protein EYF80_039160 [Liparis tanakae]